MVWREPKNHHDDGYFCMVDMSGWNQRKKKDWYYLDIESARRLTQHCAKFPVPVFTFSPDLIADEMLLEAIDDTDSSDSSISNSSSMAAAPSSLSAKPKPFSQDQLNDLVRDLDLSKNRLRFWDLVLVNMVYWIRELKLHTTVIVMIC